MFFQHAERSKSLPDPYQMSKMGCLLRIQRERECNGFKVKSEQNVGCRKTPGSPLFPLEGIVISCNRECAHTLFLMTLKRLIGSRCSL